MLIKIKLHPGSSKEEIKKLSEDHYEIWIKEKPVESKANMELIKLLKKHFNKGARIKSGLSSRNKIIKLGN